MKSIHTLIPDIYKRIEHKDGWFDEQLSREFATELGCRLVEDTKPKDERKSLRLSAMGARCPKQLWHSVHTPELAEHLPPWVRIKFTYGHILESLVISMAKSAGHAVTGEQDELVVDGIKGHRDCVIDGCIVDVKSANSRSFEKIKSGKELDLDPFISGYLDQLDCYLVGSANDPLVTVKDKAYLLVIDKTLGHLCLYEHRLREESIRERIKKYRGIVELPSPPKCECGTVNDGKSGNVKLDTKASYSPFKYACFPRLRTFLYAGGPTYLTKVVRKPDVPEIDKNGKFVYN